tara:strand:+ start:11998 stop:13413 length:1416 start_codon:yes stop_codon:yes gene_type:complete
MNNKIYSLDEALNLDEKTYHKLYRKHINSGLYSIYKILGFSQMDIENAKGLEIKLKNGKTILDFTSGIGVLGLGHNHKKIIKAEKKCQELKIIDVQKFGINKMQAALAYNLSKLLPDPLDTSFFSVSGAEAVEAGIKLITRAQPKNKKYFISFNEDYHGKTHGALAFTNSENFSKGFHIGINKENVIIVEPGDIESLKSVIKKHTTKNFNNIAGLIIEPIQGQSLGLLPKGYLKKTVELCNNNDILVLIDEIKVGMGRTGKLFSFLDENVVPDVVTISKALGGGKRAIGVMVTNSKLSKLAYGKKKDSALHSTTFSGLGTSCAVAIETLNIISNPDFLKNVEEKGNYLNLKLTEIKNKYPEIIKSIIGKGLYIGINFNFIPYENKMNKLKIPFLKDIKVALMGSIVRSLYRDYNILTHFTPPEPSMLVLMPPLIISNQEIDKFIYSLDNLLAKGLINLFSKFLINNTKELL